MDWKVSVLDCWRHELKDKRNITVDTCTVLHVHVHKDSKIPPTYVSIQQEYTGTQVLMNSEVGESWQTRLFVSQYTV